MYSFRRWNLQLRGKYRGNTRKSKSRNKVAVKKYDVMYIKKCKLRNPFPWGFTVQLTNILLLAIVPDGFLGLPFSWVANKSKPFAPSSIRFHDLEKLANTAQLCRVIACSTNFKQIRDNTSIFQFLLGQTSFLSDSSLLAKQDNSLEFYLGRKNRPKGFKHRLQSSVGDILSEIVDVKIVTCRIRCWRSRCSMLSVSGSG